MRKWEAGQVQELYSCYLLSGSMALAGRAYGITRQRVSQLFAAYNLGPAPGYNDPGRLAAIGSIGGRKTSQDRVHMADIGRKGGRSRAAGYSKEKALEGE